MMDLRLSLPAMLAALFFTWKLFHLVRNIRLAKQTGLPYAVSAIHELETPAFFTDVLLRWYCHEHLMRGQGWPSWARFMVKQWHYEDKGRAHREYGPAFLVVSAGGIICYSSDADVSMVMVTKRKTIVKMRGLTKMIEPFGPNVASTDGEQWRAHIRITMPSFGEKVHSLVWDETVRQADSLCESWAGIGKIGIKESIYSLTMNTMSFASFGWSVDSTRTPGQDCIPSGHRMCLVEAMSKVISHLPSILLLPRVLLPILPGKTAHFACSEFEKYMDELIAHENRLLTQGSSGELRRETLMTALLRARRESVDDTQSQAKTGFSLTDQEIKGNIFIFLLAGYDTTANTMIYTCVVLAIYKDIQDKARQEVDSIHAKMGDHRDLSYSEHYNCFRYLLAVMYEVMRVFPTALAITRQTESAQEVKMPGHSSNSGARASLPAGTICIVNNTGTHFSEANWPSPHIIEPRRWLAQDPNKFDPLNPSSSQSEEAASIPSHKKGTFMTFNEGPRACLGRNFTRAEFLAFFSRLLRTYKLELDEGVSGAALEWTLRCCSAGSPLTLTPPNDIKLRLVPRER